MGVHVQVFETALPLILQHVELPLHTICQLLCVSRATAAIVDASCGGKYKVACSNETLQQRRFVSWLSKHAVLLRCVEHTSTAALEEQETYAAEDQAASQQLATALITARSLPGSLMLQSLKTCSVLVTSVAASCPTLTSLDLSLNRESLFPKARLTTACITGMVGMGSMLL